MRKLILLLALLVSIGAYAQFPVDSVTKKITYTEVVSVNGASKDLLYMRAKALNAMQSSMLKDDKAGGIYSYKGSFPVKYPGPQVGNSHTGVVSYVVTVVCKEGKYKYTVTDLTHTSDKGNGGALEGALPACGKYTLIMSGWNSIKKQSQEKMNELVKAIKSAMDSPAPTAPTKNNATSTDF